jgi:hypothetical protein
VEPKNIAEVVAEFRKLGPSRFVDLYRDPMMLVRDLGYEEEDDELAFHTNVMSRAEAFGLAKAGAEPRPSLSIGTCIRIAKRDGAAFQDRIGVGRTRNVDVSIPLALMSKYHAFFAQAADGQSFEITDAGSKNGTFVDGKRLPEKQAVPLADGQEIAFGPYRFAFFTPEGFVEMVRRRASPR